MRIIPVGHPAEPVEVDASTPACKNCRFYFGDPQGGESQGLCRFKPPVVFPIPTALGSVQVMGAFAPVKTTDWCGCFVRDIDTGTGEPN